MNGRPPAPIEGRIGQNPGGQVQRGSSALGNFAQFRDLTLRSLQAAIAGMEDRNLSANLAFLCSHYPSIAEVCRRLTFNRQQFNKYLSGQSRPSRHNMRRICDFFGVTESEILLEPGRFEELVALRRRPLSKDWLDEPLSHLEILYQASRPLDRYVGYYFRYFYSFGYPGRIIRSLCTIFEKGGKYYWKNLEVLRSANTGNPTTISKYIGSALLIADRIFIFEYESLRRNSLTQVTLYPSYQTRVDQLVGVQTGGPVRRGRKPGASRVVLEYLGPRVNAREALNQSGLFDQDDDRIGGNIRALIRNDIADGSYVLEVEEP
jgi:transcriptional regulator with XRE-family HTH domain